MRVRRGDIARTVAMAVLLVTLTFAAFGCQAQPAQWSELEIGGPQQQSQRQQGAVRIEPQAGREVADLSPDDVIQIMRRIGFTDAQILDMGTDMRDALRMAGGARVIVREEVEALVSVSGMRVHVGSRTRGNFTYDLGSGQFVTTGGHR